MTTVPSVGLRALSGMLVLALVGGCTDDDGEVRNAAVLAVGAPPVEVSADAAEGVLGSEEAVLGAGELRLLLEQLLGEHVLLVAGAAADHAHGQSTQVALAAVADNTEDLTDAIGLAYGDVGARAFASLWSQHVAFLLDHARGTAAQDDEVVEEAHEHLHDYGQGFGSFAETATGGALPTDAVAQLLEVHVRDINGHVAARLADDPEAAVDALVSGHDEAARIGAALAGAIAGQGPAAFPGDRHDERVEVAAELARAFAQWLAVRACGPELGPEAAAAAHDRIGAALRGAAQDPDAAVIAWERLTALPAGTRQDADALAEAIGIPTMGAHLAAVATAPEGDPTAPEVIDAHRAAYELAAAWLG